jgi:hypothetical protein
MHCHTHCKLTHSFCIPFFFLSPAEQVLDNVAFARAHNSEQQMDLLKIASAMMSEDRYIYTYIHTITANFTTRTPIRSEIASVMMSEDR